MNFPEKFTDDGGNFYFELARKASLICQLIIHGEDEGILSGIEQIEKWQLGLMTPKNFDSEDPDNYIKRIDLSFESLLTSMEEVGVTNPGDLTVFQFYTKLTYFERKKQKQLANRKTS